MSIDIIKEVDAVAEKLKQQILCSKSEIQHSGNTYYISNDGDDNNDGLTTQTPWKSLRKASEFKYKVGDAILLQRGSIFREMIELKCGGVLLSAYGEGDKPKIYGSPKNFNSPEDWQKTEIENVYVCNDRFDRDVGNIVCNEGKYYGLKQVVGNFGFNGGISELKNDMEFFYEPTEKKLYLYSISNPSERFYDVEICVAVNVLIMADDITVDNLCCKYASRHAICGPGHNNVVVKNCEVGWAGGAILSTNPNGTSIRYGNAIELYGPVNGFIVKHNYIYQVYDSGITNQYWQDANSDIYIENILYSENLIEYCSISVEYALSKQSNSNQHIKNMVIEDNVLRYAGYGFGSQRPDKEAAAHIKTWEAYNTVDNVIIRNNILDRSKRALIHIAGYEGQGLPILSGNTYIQAEGRELGRYGTVPTTLILTDNDDFFCFDENAKVEIVKNDLKE